MKRNPYRRRAYKTGKFRDRILAAVEDYKAGTIDQDTLATVIDTVIETVANQRYEPHNKD